jgi:hypothetical protein
MHLILICFDVKEASIIYYIFKMFNGLDEQSEDIEKVINNILNKDFVFNWRNIYEYSFFLLQLILNILHEKSHPQGNTQSSCLYFLPRWTRKYRNLNLLFLTSINSTSCSSAYNHSFAHSHPQSWSTFSHWADHNRTCFK